MSRYTDYEILDKKPLGSGGNANVFLALKKGTEEKVALKLLKVGGRYLRKKRIDFVLKAN